MTWNQILVVLQILWMAALYLGPVVLIVGSILLVRRRRGQIERGDGLAAIATAVGGEVARDPVFRSPFVRFNIQGARGYLYQWLLGTASPYTITTIECRAAFPAYLEVLSGNSKRYMSAIRRFHERAGVLDFRLITTDELWTQEILEDGLEKILADLRDWTRKPARIQLGPSRFIMEIETRLDANQAATLAGLVARVAALAQGTRSSAGVQFLGEMQFSSQGRCAVCAQVLADPRVLCGSCRIPHHADCWSYTGRCAIFGCGSRSAAPA